MTVRHRIRWAAMHGFIRAVSTLGARRGDPQARLIADPAARDDPATFADELRPRGPVIRGRAALLTFDHGVINDVLRSDDFRTVPQGSNLPTPLRWVIDRTDTGLMHPIQPPSLLSIEPPDHTRCRKLVSSVFTARAVAALRDRVQQRADALLDTVAGADDVVDVVPRYCSQLPVAVISDILGVDEADRPHILRFGELGAPSLDIGLSWPQYREVHEGVLGFNLWLRGHMEHLRRDPGEDFMSQLILASRDATEDTRLSDEELEALAGLVLAAGFETTVNLLGNGIRLLLDTPEHLDTLAARPELWPNAVEEILRLDPPVQMTARTARRDVDLAGTPVSRGETIILHLAGANRDPSVFTDPHRFDIERDNAGRHLSFSGGRHFCLGAALARLEGEIGLRSFFDRFPDTRLAGSGSRRDTRVLRGWSALPITLGAAPAALNS